MGRGQTAQQLNETDVLPLANLESRSDWSTLKQVEIRPNARGLSRTLGVPPREKLKACGRVTGGFISRSLGRTVSGRLRSRRPLPGGLAVNRHSSPNGQKRARLRRAAQQLNEADQPPRRCSEAILVGKVIGWWLAAYLGRWASRREKG